MGSVPVPDSLHNDPPPIYIRRHSVHFYFLFCNAFLAFVSIIWLVTMVTFLHALQMNAIV